MDQMLVDSSAPFSLTQASLSNFGMGDISTTITAASAGPYAHDGFVADTEFPISRSLSYLKAMQASLSEYPEYSETSSSPILPKTPPSTPVTTPRPTPDANTRAKFRAERMASRKSSTYDKSPQKKRNAEEAGKRAQHRNAIIKSRSYSPSSSLQYFIPLPNEYTVGFIGRYMTTEASSSKVKVEDMVLAFPSKPNVEELLSYMAIDDDKE